MTKKPQNRLNNQKPKDETYKISYKTPTWMREFLDAKGIETDCSLSELSKDQWLAIDLAERLWQQEIKGVISVTYDPDKNSEPQAELTDQAINTPDNRQVNTYGEDTKTPSEETLP